MGTKRKKKKIVIPRKKNVLPKEKKGKIPWLLLSSMAVGFFAFVFFPTIDKGIFLGNNDNYIQTTGEIISLNENNAYIQGSTGSHYQTVSYDIVCKFYVNNVQYEAIKTESYSQTTHILSKIGYPQNKNVKIFYNKKEPRNFSISTK